MITILENMQVRIIPDKTRIVGPFSRLTLFMWTSGFLSVNCSTIYLQWLLKSIFIANLTLSQITSSWDDLLFVWASHWQ